MTTDSDLLTDCGDSDSSDCDSSDIDICDGHTIVKVVTVTAVKGEW